MEPTKERRSERLFSPFSKTKLLCDGGEIEIAGQKLVPDQSTAYVQFSISHAFPAITAYKTTLHPGTVANSFASMNHKVFNLAHLMKSYDTSKEKNEISQDRILGTVVGVELLNPRPSFGTWKLRHDAAESTGIRAVAAMHKNADRVPKILGEHLAGRKKWSVSMEVEYSPAESGFLVANRSKAKKGATALMDEFSPRELEGTDLGYVPALNAPEELLMTYSMEKCRIVKPWGDLPVTLMKGGFNGNVHYYGVGLVTSPAEREAEVERMMAHDPDAIEGLINEELSMELVGYFQKSAEEMKNLLTLLQNTAQTDL